MYVIQDRNRPLMSTAPNTHGTNASPDGLCARAHNNEAFSCWSCCKSFRFGRARRSNVCFGGDGWAVFKKLKYHNVFFTVLEKKLPNEASAKTRQVGRQNVYHVDRVPETCCK